MVAVGAGLEHARDQHDAAQHERQRGEQPALGPLAEDGQATNGTMITWGLPSTVASPAPTSAIAWCQKIRSAAKKIAGGDRQPPVAQRPRAEAAILEPGDQPEHRQRVEAAEDRRGRGSTSASLTRIAENAIVSAPATATTPGRRVRTLVTRSA